MTPSSLAQETEVSGAELQLYRASPASTTHCPDAEVGEADRVFRTSGFSLRTSGNFTNGTPKSSYKVSFTGKESRLYGMRALNLKSMWNDVSQMREAIAWRAFAASAVPASRQIYAKLCINDRYYGLYSLIEQVDQGLLQTWFGKNDKGNLYKAYWLDIGPADLGYRQGSDGDDSGRQYYTAADIDARTYQLKTNDKDDDDPALQSYDDLARFIRVLNGVGLPGEGAAKFDTVEYRESLERIFDVRGFLRWASLNVLLGAWDNYWRTPGNYYLYDSGKAGAEKSFMAEPYFHWIPWDYDNSLGIDMAGVAWQSSDIVDWRKDTGAPTLPLVENALANGELRAYYLDHLEYLLDQVMNEGAVLGRIGDEGGGGLWDLARASAYLEADGPTATPHTGRRFTNDQVFWNGFRHEELSAFGFHTFGIQHFVRMRHDSARQQLVEWRAIHPKGSSGASFPAKPSPLPPVE
jgi:hypothetical protein